MLTMNYLLKSLPSIFVFIKYYKIGLVLVFIFSKFFCAKKIFKKKKQNLNKVFKALFVLNFVNK